MYSIKVVGDGVFGTFMKELILGLSKTKLDNDAHFVMLAVPFSAYRTVAKAHEGKHLINVCSVQEETNEICSSFTKYYTGIHPMFGPRSTGHRTAVVTHESVKESNEVINLFHNMGAYVYTSVNNKPFTGAIHDRMMAKTHLQVVKISDQIAEMVRNADDIPDGFLPNSFRKLRELNSQFMDMPEGTKSSILANKYEG